MGFPTREYQLILSVNSEFTQPPMKVKQDDSYSNIFKIQLLSNFLAIDLTGYAIKFTVRKPDTIVVFQTPTVIDAVGGKIAVVLSTQTLAVAGLAEAEVSLYGTDGERITLFEFIFEVDANIDPTNAIMSSNDLPALTEMIAISHAHSNKATLDTIPTTDGVTVGKVLKTSANGTLIWGEDVSSVGEGGTSTVTQESVNLLTGRVGAVETGKANAVHNHAISEVTALQTSLDAKSATSHTHSTLYPDKTATETHTASTSNPHATTKTHVGLSNADNTSDVNKPVSTAMSTALADKSDTSHLHTGVYATVGQVLTNVPAGAVFTDTVYVHPTNHAISVITGLQTALDNKVDDSQVLTNVPAGALFTDNDTVTTINGKTGVIVKADIVALGMPAQDTDTVYTHPATHPATMITEDSTHRFTTDAEQTAWDAKEPAISKLSGFNLATGTTGTTLALGNHLHTGVYAPISHAHIIADVTGLQTALDSAGTTDLTGYTTVAEASTIYALNLLSKPSLNFKIESTNATAKSVTVANILTVAEIFLEVKYTTACALTWFSGIVWLGGSAPTLTAGKVYRMAFFTADAGTTWHGVSQGGW